MSLRNGWLIEQAVVINQFKGDLRQDDLHAVNKTLLHYLEATDAPLLHFVNDFTMANQMHDFKSQSQLEALRHKQLGWTLMIGTPNTLMRFFLSLTAQLFKIRIRFVNTYAEAEAFLRSVYPDLPAFPPYEAIHWQNHVNWQDETSNETNKAATPTA